MKEPRNIIMTEHFKIIQYDSTLDITDKKNLDQTIIRKEAITLIQDRSDKISIDLVNGKEFYLDRDIDVWTVLVEWIRDS